MTKILVTGSGGFLGSHLVDFLQRQRMEVVEISRRTGYDLEQPHALDAVPAVDVVVHLSAVASVALSLTDPAAVYRANLQMMLNVLEYCRKKQVTKFCFTSSYIYGPPQYLPVDEHHPRNIANPYGKSKMRCEDLSHDYAALFGVTPVILRLFNVYGPRQNANFLIPTIIRQIMAGDTVELNDLKPRRDYIYVGDVVEIIARVLTHDGVQAPRIFNVGAGVSTDVATVVALLCRIAGKKLPVRSREQIRPLEIADCYADTTALRNFLGWQPQIALEEGLQRTWNWYTAHPHSS